MIDSKKLAELAKQGVETRRLVTWYWSDKHDPRDANSKHLAFESLDCMDKIFADLAASHAPEIIQ